MKKLFFFLVITLSLLADEEETEDINFGAYPVPWFTGPLIAPSGYTVRPGSVGIQSYFDSFVRVGSYDSHWIVRTTPNFYNYRLRVRFRTGITGWMDGEIIPQISYKETEGKSSFGFDDFIIGLNFQLATPALHDSWPAFKLRLRTAVPCGKYQKLNPHCKHTDARGMGSWYPEIALILSKLWHLSGIHYFEIRAYSGYRFGTPASVSGLTVYGGGKGTHGTAYPGDIFFVNSAIQCNFSQNFAFACDFLYSHRNRSRFCGKREVPATLPSREEFSLAPALEYNFSKKVGLIGGVWFSFAGRNCPQYINGILSLNAYI